MTTELEEKVVKCSEDPSPKVLCGKLTNLLDGLFIRFESVFIVLGGIDELSRQRQSAIH
jgi:hypothetical protein